MGNKDALININDLREGMVVAKEIVVNNNVLVVKGTRITQGIIKKLRDVYLENALIVDGEEIVKENRKLDYAKELKEVRKTLRNFAYQLENIFEKIRINGKTDIDDLRNFSQRIIDELTSPRIIIKNIIMDGSKEDCVFKHSVNVSLLSLLLGKWLRLSGEEISLLLYSAILHDFGKTKINNKSLCTPGRLSNEEIESIKNHPIIAYNLVKDIPYLSKAVKYGIVMHHERLDGSGYPLGLKDDEIHKFAKIIGIADTFDNIISNREKEKDVNPFKALEIIKGYSLEKLDYNYCSIFIEGIINYYFGENVILNNNKVCKIINIDINNLTQPLLQCGEEFIDFRKQKELKIKGFVMN